MARFYLDHDFPIQVAAVLRQMGHQATTTRDLGAEGEPDYLQLLIAARHEWILITHNWKDFKLLHGAWQAWSLAWSAPWRHAGILVVTQSSDAAQRAGYAGLIHGFVGGRTDPLYNQLHRYEPANGWVNRT